MNELHILHTVRAGDAARDRIIACLGDCLVSGHLDQDEYMVRLEAAASAHTHDQLAALVSDLPPGGYPRDPSPPPARRVNRTAGLVLAAGTAWAGAVLGLGVMIISVVLLGNVAWGAGVFLGGLALFALGGASALWLDGKVRARRRKS